MIEKTGKIYEFGEFRLETGEQVLMRGGEPVAVTPKVFDLLAVLVENHGHLLTKDELFGALWADQFVEEANLNVNVSALRRVLGEKPNESRYIETVPRRGYRFVAEVRKAEPEKSGESFSLTGESDENGFGEARTLFFDSPARHCPLCKKNYYDRTLNFCLDDGANLKSGETAEAESAATLPSAFWERRRLVGRGIWLALLLATVAGVLIWRHSFSPDETGASEIRTIAVLPFKPLAGEGSDTSLELGMADALITKLSGLRQITVRPTGTISKYVDPGADPLLAGRELEVDAVLDGKIQRSDDKIRVTVQLLRVSDGSTVWAGSFDDFFTNIFAVQDSISEKLTASLALKISGEEQAHLAKRPTENTEAYALFLKARYYHEQISRETSIKAIELYRQAVKKDPEFALAYSWMTGAFLHLANLNIDRAENWRNARDSATRSVELDPELADAHEALATVKDVIDWNWNEAETEYRKAIELDPKNPDGHYSYSLFLSRFKRFDEAVREIETAQKINPVAIYMQTAAVTIRLRQRSFDEAIRQADKVFELDPHNQQALYLLTRLYSYKSMSDEANQVLRNYSELNPSNARSVAAFVYLNTGRKTEAEKILRELVGKYREGDSCSPQALYHLWLGDRDGAFEFLEKAFQRREITVLTLGVDPEWDQIRTDPRFQDLIRRADLIR
ncbi:MAG: winged helix-turn-helix domain-containing protein [Pyrinomonadaceae bacterium]